MRVDVYFNLHRKCWSLRDRSTGRVIEHTDHVALTLCEFIVWRGGQRRVREEGRKNVHAFVRGTWELDVVPDFGNLVSYANVTYNPYENDTFVQWWFGEALPIDFATGVVMNIEHGRPSVVAYNPKIPMEVWIGSAPLGAMAAA